MRDILFRGKRVDNGEWVKGYYVYEVSKNIHWIFENSLGAINPGFKPRKNDYGLVNVEVIPETISQFTGLEDKNGNKIFEGDILDCKFHHRYVERISWKGKPDAICTVIYDFNGFRLKAKGEEDERYADFFDFLDNMEYKQQMHDLSLAHTEIIGNIHEVTNETTM